MPTSSSSSIARFRPSRLDRPEWASRTSPICRPMRWTGFSELIGSWKIIAISLPRTARSSRCLSPISSRPSSWMLPETSAPWRRPMSESAVTLLPEPDSPTNPSDSPAASENPTPLTACTRGSPPPPPKLTTRSLTFSSGGSGSSRISACTGDEGLPPSPRVERVVDGVSHQAHRHEHDRQYARRGEHEPGVVAPLAQVLVDHPSEARLRRPDADPEKAQRRLEEERPSEGEADRDDQRPGRVREEVLRDDPPALRALRARCKHELALAE